MNTLKQSGNGGENGITEIKSESIKNGCENIMPRKWTRKCPDCNIDIEYGSRKAYHIAIKFPSRRCRWCKQKGKQISNETRQKLSVSRLGKGHPHTEKHKQNMRGSGNGMYGIHRYDIQNPFYGKHHTEEARRKMRIAACKRVIKLQRNNNGRINNVGKKEGRYFRKLERKNGWNGIFFSKSRRQYLIEPLGYFVDYFEPNLNIVVEYDEPRHYKNGTLKAKDIKRMEEIKQHLGCQVWRYNEYTGILTK